MSKLRHRRIEPLIVFILLLIASSCSFALPFIIVTATGTSLPTRVIPGQTVKGFYTVSNNTGSVRAGNFVKYLPPNVTQVVMDPAYPDLCGATFTLNPRDSIGSSCTLELNISGSVNANDPDPHHHLFVCFPGGKSCAGTSNSLNVASVTPTPYTLAYVADFNANYVTLCSINAKGTFSNCQDSGAGAIFDTPATLAFTSSFSFVYVTNFNGGGGTVVSLCAVNPITGQLSGCINADEDGTAVFSGPLGVSVNAAGTFAYVANIGDNTVSSCSINPVTAKLSQCVSNSDGFLAPISALQLNGSGSQMYITNTALGSIFVCSLDTTTGTLSGCINADSDGSAVFDGPALMSLTAGGTRLYVSDNGGGGGTSVTVCSVNLFTSKLYNCKDSGVGPIFLATVAVTLNADNTVLYVSNNNGTTVSLCPIDSNTGQLISCSNADGDGSAVFNGPAGVTLK